MLDHRATSIEYQTQTRGLELLEELYDNKLIGEIKSSTWSNVNTIRFYLEVLADKDSFTDTQVTDLTHIYECLIEVGDINNFPAPSGNTSVSAPVTIVGIQGPAGPSGQSAYLYIGFASDTLGSDFSLSPDASRQYIAVLNSTSPILTVTSTSFSGLWKKYLGDDGADGSDGSDGSDGADGNTILNGTSNPTTEGVDGDFFINTNSNTIFGPKASGTWPSGVSIVGPSGSNGTNGTNGVDGRTILNGSGVPSNGLGDDGDFYIDTLNNTLYGPKAGGVWGSSTSIVGPTGATGSAGNNGSDGSDGDSSYLYIAYADNINGSGFTLTFDTSKDYTAWLVTTSASSPSQTDFDSLWFKYKGDGDNWATFSATSMTIGTGTKSFIVETSLAYTTGQYVVIAEDNVPGNRMEGYVISYDRFTGQMSVDVDTVAGSGTIANWDVNLQGAGTPSPGTGSPFENLDVDIATSPEVVDSFTSSSAKGVVWDFVIEQGTIRRVSSIVATWQSTTVAYAEYGAVEIGDSSPVTMSVDIDSGNARLLATVTTDNWIITGRRYLIVN